MPIREFICKFDHLTERVLLGEADKLTTIGCSECAKGRRLEMAKRVEFSVSNARFLGEGFYKPSAVQGPMVGATDPTKILPEFTTYDSQGKKVDRSHVKKLNQQIGVLNDAREGRTR